MIEILIVSKLSIIRNLGQQALAQIRAFAQGFRDPTGHKWGLQGPKWRENKIKIKNNYNLI